MGPLVLGFGFCNGVIIPLPIWISSFFSKHWFRTFVIAWWSDDGPYFIYSQTIMSNPGALLLFIALLHFCTSSTVIGLFRGLGSFTNGLIVSSFWSKKWSLKCFSTTLYISWGAVIFLRFSSWTKVFLWFSVQLVYCFEQLHLGVEMYHFHGTICSISLLLKRV